MIVINAQNGIEMITSAHDALGGEAQALPHLIVNKIDAENVDLPEVLAESRTPSARNACRSTCRRTAASTSSTASSTRRASPISPRSRQAHRALIDQVVEVDEELMAIYLEKGEVEPEQLHAPFEKALREGHLIPVCFTSARNGAGVTELLDVIVKLLPNPTEGNPPPFFKGDGEKRRGVPRRARPGKHVLAHVFKVTIDPYVGKLGVFRVHQGTVTPDTQLFVGDGASRSRSGTCTCCRARTTSRSTGGVPGDIAAVAKIDEIQFDHVLHDSHDEDHMHLRPLEFPTPMFGARDRAEEARRRAAPVGRAAQARRRGPRFRIEHDPTTQRDRDPRPGRPAPAHDAGEDDHAVQAGSRHQAAAHPVPRDHHREGRGPRRHKKQTGGAGQFGEVFLRIEPLPRGDRLRVRRRGQGRRDPDQFIPAVEKGVRRCSTPARSPAIRCRTCA